ncbi:MAG: hypothetical protein V3V41_02045 [Candidatus Heimdallarchaeota archaeon]
MKKKICLFHDIGWSGQDVEYSGCEDCKAKNLVMYYAYGYDKIMKRPAPP